MELTSLPPIPRDYPIGLILALTPPAPATQPPSSPKSFDMICENGLSIPNILGENKDICLPKK
jgi:hypothetical protein